MKHFLLVGVLGIVLGFQIQLQAANVVPVGGIYTGYTESAYNGLVNQLVPNTAVNGGQCASTSLVNSFLYLEAAYPNVFGATAATMPNALTGGQATQASATTARNSLDTAIVNAGGLQGAVWNQKLTWLQTYAPGKYTVSGVTSVASGSAQGMGYTIQKGSVQFSQTGAQMWAWLQGQIKAGEDVELGMYNHMTTVMGYATSGSGASMKMWMEIIDPNNPTGNGASNTPGMGVAATVGPGSVSNGPVGEWVQATYDRNGLLRLSGFSAGAYTNPNIYYMFAESPAPEPATVTMLVIGAGCLVVFHWRKRKQVAAALPA